MLKWCCGTSFEQKTSIKCINFTIRNGWYQMRKLTIITMVLLTLVLSACNFPGYEGAAPQDADSAMATEIARILTGTPVEIEETEPVPDEQEQAATEAPEVESTEVVAPDDKGDDEEAEEAVTPEATETPMPTAELADTDPVRTLGDPDWVDTLEDGDNWATGPDPFSSIAINQGFLKLTSATELNGWRLTWPYLKDFYLETTIQTPDCSGGEHFGLMFRVPNVSNSSQGYLFGISCDARYSLKIWNYPSMQYLVGWTDSDAIKTGENAINVLGVMAKGANLSLYINGQKVKDLTDNTYLEGGFGVFVGDGSEGLTIWMDQIRYWENP